MTDEQYAYCALTLFEAIPGEPPADTALLKNAIIGMSERWGHNPHWFFIVLRFCFEFHEWDAEQSLPVFLAAIEAFDPGHSVNPDRWLGETFGGGGGTIEEIWESFD